MQIVAEIWLILPLTGSGVAVGLAPRCSSLPILLLGALGGLLADRLAKRRLLILTQTAMVVPRWRSSRSLPPGVVEPWMVFALVFVRGSVNAVDYPTRQSFVIEIVGADRVVNAVGLNSVLVHSARIIGPAIAGVLIAALGRRALLPHQRALLRGDDRRARDDGPGALRPPPSRCPRARGAVRAALRYVRAHPRAARSRSR